MTRYSVHRFRAAVLHMYLRIAALVSLPLSVIYFLFIPTPDDGLVLFTFGLFAFLLKWYIRHEGEGSLRFSNLVVLVFMCLMLYGSFTSHERLHQEVWMMIFPVVFVPIVEQRSRIIWMVVGALSFIPAVLLRPEPLTVNSAFVLLTAYLTLGYVTFMLVRHNEHNIERLAHMSIIDPLTRVYNRGYLKEVMAGEINRCKRSKYPLTVIMLDIDYFKLFNDNYGHLFGDNVLEQVADVLRRTAQRAGDYVFRYGGEEFCILTSGLTHVEAGQFAEVLRLSVRALNIENNKSPHRCLTASVGFWCVSDLGEITPDALLLNADEALYCAKAAGRDTVVNFDSKDSVGEGRIGETQNASA